MMLLILDLIRRRWKSFLFVLGVSAWVAFLANLPLIYAPFTLLLLFSDTQRGSVRVIRTLPVSAKTLGVTLWTIGVPLGVLLLVVTGVSAVVIGNLIRFGASGEWSIPDASEFGFAILIQSCFALIISALAFLALSFLSHRPAENGRQLALEGVFGVFWVGCLVGGFFQGMFFPYRWDDMQPWHWALLGAGPFVIARSYTRAKIFILRRLTPVAHGAADESVSERAESGRVTGAALYLQHIIGRAVLFTILIGLLQYAILLSSSYKSVRGEGLNIIQIAIFGVLVGAFMTELVNLRSLRTLPISTTKLTLLLLSTACAIAVVASAFPLLTRIPWDLRAVRVLQSAQEALVTAGVGAILIALFLWLPGWGHLWVIVSSLILVPWTIGAVIWIPSGLGFLGGVLLALGYFLTFWGLRHSQVFYRSRPLIGIANQVPR